MQRSKSILSLVRRASSSQRSSASSPRQRTPESFSLQSLSLPDEEVTPWLDHKSFPSIVETILSFSTRETLIAFRGTCKALKKSADEKLARHARFGPSRTEDFSIEAPDGRLPAFSPHGKSSPSQTSGSRSPSPTQLQFPSLSALSVSGRRRRRLPLILPPPPLPITFSDTRIVDIAMSQPPLQVTTVLERAPIGMIRLVPAVKLPFYQRPIPTLEGLTIVHFWMERTCLLPVFPAAIQGRITKVVFTVRHYCPVPERLRWCESYNARYPNVHTVVFVFGSNAPNGPQWITDPSYFHEEHQCAEDKARPCMFTTFVAQVARILVCAQGATITLVALRDVPHPRFLGVIIPDPLDGTLGLQLETHFLDEVEKALQRTAPDFGVEINKDKLEAYMGRVRMASLDEYRDQTEREQFDLEVHA